MKYKKRSPVTKNSTHKRGHGARPTRPTLNPPLGYFDVSSKYENLSFWIVTFFID